MTKMAVFYYSSTGANYQLAQWAESALKEAGAEVKLVKIPETAPMEAIEQNPAWKKHYEETKDVPEASIDDLEWADGYIFSVPTRFGALPSQAKQFIDMAGGLWGEGKLVNKVVSGMTSAANPHGGQEQTLTNLYTSMYHWGAIVVPPGYSDNVIFGSGGNPYGTSTTVDGEGNITDDVKGAVEHQARRTYEITKKISE
ncbi:NAD(P)H:quinone oxidoreductase, type IV [Halalkalibacillus sediminis]|uniref:NAD(P)H:quinone oxidoreductase, type IV n=1 Tax=Halalkalibacillus sediminis TaxID=2018042 RepID=A0A2I0QV81_9BACI|nr:NAD(P)H:quinone oxidoreductase [Halalkalibacillus sediminis]PKR78253.1 NAD(P)H:quinone oxidoreductase, type IV [Halalkalibacillus sediminis]